MLYQCICKTTSWYLIVYTVNTGDRDAHTVRYTADLCTRRQQQMTTSQRRTGNDQVTASSYTHTAKPEHGATTHTKPGKLTPTGRTSQPNYTTTL